MNNRSPLLLRGGIAALVLGLVRGLTQWFGISRVAIRDSLIDAIPYIWPIALMMIGATALVVYINHDPTPEAKL